MTAPLPSDPVAHHRVDSPLGPLLLVATPAGLARVAFAHEPADEVIAGVVADLGRRAGVPPTGSGTPAAVEADPSVDPAEVLAVAATQLGEYFAGRRTGFDVPLDRGAATGFRALVQRRLCDIPYGRTRTYAQVAAEVGNPQAVRAVGSACGANPLPVVVPCHRVLRSDGGLGGYRGGTDAKRVLLRLEGAGDGTDEG